MKWIKERLDEVGRRPIELSRALGLPPARVYEMIKGIRRVQPDEIGRMAAFLEWPETHLVAMIDGLATSKAGSIKQTMQKARFIRASQQISVTARSRPGRVSRVNPPRIMGPPELSRTWELIEIRPPLAHQETDQNAAVSCVMVAYLSTGTLPASSCRSAC